MEQPISIDNVSYIGGNTYHVLISDSVESGINNITGDITITINGMTNDAGYTYDEIIENFTPTNLNPGITPIPEVEVIWNE